MANKHTAYDLAQMQSLPLEAKILMAKRRIQEWYDYWDGGVYVSFSGGKDSTALLHLVRSMYPDVEAVFVNTGLEYPEIQQFVKTFDNVTILRPKMRFDDVIKKYGYPVISKDVSRKIYYAREGRDWAMRYVDGTAKMNNANKSMFCVEKYKLLLQTDFMCADACCAVMKKSPAKTFARKTGKKPITAQMAAESKQRTTQWMLKGCNAFESKNPISNPMSFWTEQDVLRYIKVNDLPIASVYGEIVEKDEDGYEYDTNLVGEQIGKYYTTGCNRTGCIFCAFGCHLEKSPTRFQLLKQTHPHQYNYCIGGGEYVDGIWQPSKEGLGMGHVFDELNAIYGDGFIKY